MKDLGNRARTGKLMPQDIEGGTFSVTNAGGYGAINSTPIISQPQVAILGVHAIQERPVVRDGEIVIRHMMNFGLAFDHRLIDGHYAVQFLRRTITLLEEPAFMLL
jgi:2-oxoglutarate dehydrogenase E2 component (dihydrolipoamide succinyltransferase)